MFQVGELVHALEAGAERAWPAIVVRAENGLHDVVRFSTAGAHVLTDVAAVGSLAEANSPDRAGGHSVHVLYPLAETPANEDQADEPVEGASSSDDDQAAATPAKATRSKAAAK